MFVNFGGVFQKSVNFGGVFQKKKKKQKSCCRERSERLLPEYEQL
jgi:hypothetical protein